MAENASVFIGTQIGVESVAGTSVAANKRLLAVSVQPAIKAEVKTFRPLGQKYNTLAVLGKEYVEAKLMGDLAYNDLTYLLASALSYAAPTQIIPTTGLAYEWAHEPNQSDVDTIKTFTIESGASVRAGKFSYGLVNEIGYKITREEATLSGSMLGQLYTDGITLTTSPTDVALKPVIPNTVDIFLDTTGAGIGTTKLLRALEADFKLSNIYGQVWPLNSANTSWAAHVETAPKAELKLLLEADADGMALLTDMRAGSKVFVRVKATGADIDPSANPYSFQHDLALEVTDVSEFKDDGGIYAIEWTFEVSYDATWGHSHIVTLVNTLSAL